MRTRKWIFVVLVMVSAATVFGQQAKSKQATKAEEDSTAGFAAIFDNPEGRSPRDLYKMAHEAFTQGNSGGARLLALRVFLDGHRSSNLLDLLGAIEIKDGHNLLAGEWLRKAISLKLDDAVARKLLARFPPPPRPIPMDPAKLTEHFANISQRLPLLLSRLTTPKLHFDAVLDEIARGQFYKALALSEEFEKRYPGLDGSALTALCAFYLGRVKDATQLAEQGLMKSPHHSLFLFVKAMVTDIHPETSAPSHPRALYDQDKWGQAMTAADIYSSFFPKSAEGQLVKARILLDRMQPQEAKPILDEAAKRDPDHPTLELLKAEFFSQTGDEVQAAEAIKRAFKRGYNLPSVSLKAGLMAVAAGRQDDAKGFLDEALNGMPFQDRDGYPLFVQLALAMGRTDEARTGLDQWAARGFARSMYYYLEAMFAYRSGNTDATMDWIRKGFACNPDQVGILNVLAGIPMLQNDPALASQILAKLNGNPAPLTPVPPVSPTQPVTADTVPTGTTQPSQPVQPAQPETSFVGVNVGTRYRLQVQSDLDQAYVQALQGNLDTTFSRLEGVLGSMTEPIDISIVSAAGMGTRVAMFDPNTEVLTVSALFLDQGTLKALLTAEKPDLSDEETTLLSQYLPWHDLAHEMTLAFLMKKIPKVKGALPTTRWMIEGLAEILGGADEVLKCRLKIAAKSLTGEEAKLTTAAKLSELFIGGKLSQAVLETSYAQAYLMAAFLVKKGANQKAGINSFVSLIQNVSEGDSLDSALNKNFSTSANQFESGWKESAYWSLRQGIPYEWQ